MSTRNDDWLITMEGDYVSLKHVVSAVAMESDVGTEWGMQVTTVEGSKFWLMGTWDTESDAQGAFGKLIAAWDMTPAYKLHPSGEEPAANWVSDFINGRTS